jgi:elongation factor G
MAAEALPRAAAPARRPSVAKAAASASRLLLGQRPFLAPSASRFAAGRAAVAGPAAGLRPFTRRPRLSVVAMAGSGE